jgi:hypothetical protein
VAKEQPCRWVTRSEALSAFVTNVSGTQSAGHIKPLHWYVACRLVVEGGFLPEEVTPRPPLRAAKTGDRWVLEHASELAGHGEQTVLGGLKTKDIDVVATKPGIGPVLAVSVKGTLNAFRNLTNRMEEAAGDCANVHLFYPGLVYGFLHMLRGTTPAPGVPPNDVALTESGEMVDAIARYHEVLTRLTDRSGIRNEVSKYEVVGLGIASTDPQSLGELVAAAPTPDSPLHIQRFFDKLYCAYDLRFVYSAPGLKDVTTRIEWASSSPALATIPSLDYAPRISD